MSDTAVGLTPPLRERLATGHDEQLGPVANWDFAVLAGAGVLRSTVYDLLIFLEANLGLRETPLREAMERTHAPQAADPAMGMDIGLGWIIAEEGDRQFVWHNGATGGYSSFIGFDPQAREGVVILSNSVISVDGLAYRLLTRDLQRVSRLAKGATAGSDLSSVIPHRRPPPNLPGRVRTRAGSPVERILDSLIHTPAITAAEVQATYRLSAGRASQILHQLAEADILRLSTHRAGRAQVWVAHEVIDAVDTINANIPRRDPRGRRGPGRPGRALPARPAECPVSTKGSHRACPEAVSDQTRGAFAHARLQQSKIRICARSHGILVL